MRLSQFLASLVLFPVALSAQDYVQPDSAKQAEPPPAKRDPRPLRDRLYFGGNVGLYFGTISSVSVEPFVGYKVDQQGKFSVGTGISYWYYKDSYYDIETNSYGYRIFSRYRVLQPVFLHAEWAQQNYEFYYINGLTTREWVPMLLLGGGYVSGGEGASFMVQVLWDVLQDPRSPYGGSPIISVGVGFGF